MNGVTSHRDGPVLRIILDRPDRRNAVNTSMLREIGRLLDLAAHDDAIGVVVLAGRGEAFCAGGDLTGVDTDGADTAANDAVQALIALPKPVVAAVHGAAAGLGCALALACDLVVAARSAFFQLTFTRVGLMPDGGTSALLTATIGRARAARMALLAERIPADTAADWGLISHLADDAEFARTVDSVVTVLADGPTQAYGYTKHALSTATLGELGRLQDLESDGQRTLVTTDYFRRAASKFRRRGATPRPRPGPPPDGITSGTRMTKDPR